MDCPELYEFRYDLIQVYHLAFVFFRWLDKILFGKENLWEDVSFVCTTDEPNNECNFIFPIMWEHLCLLKEYKLNMAFCVRGVTTGVRLYEHVLFERSLNKNLTFTMYCVLYPNEVDKHNQLSIPK